MAEATATLERADRDELIDVLGRLSEAASALAEALQHESG
jgi:hypothetical protein